MKILRKQTQQAGSVLLMALVITSVIGVLLAAYLTLIKVQNQSVMRSQSWNAAIPIIEAGIEDALTHLSKHGKTNVNCDFWQPSGSGYVKEQPVGEDGYYNAYIYNYVPGDTNYQNPIIESRGFIRPPVMVAGAAGARGPLIAGLSMPFQPNGLIGRGVKATCRVDPLFAKGMVALGLIDMNGNNVVTDSFNSLTTNNVNGRYAPSVALGHGDVATDSNLVNVAGATIHGGVATGPGGTVSVKNGVVTGPITDDMNIDFPEAELPFDAGTAGVKFTADGTKTTINGTNYTQIYSGGNYKISPASQFQLSGKETVLIQGTVTIWFPQDFSISGGGGFVLERGAHLIIYAGADSSVSGNGIGNTGDPTECVIYGLPTCSRIAVSGNGEFCGLIYAPNSDLTLGGGGNSNYAFTGASVSKSAKLGGNVSFYYDEAIRMRGPIRGFVLTSWNEMDPVDVRKVPVAN